MGAKQPTHTVPYNEKLYEVKAVYFKKHYMSIYIYTYGCVRIYIKNLYKSVLRCFKLTPFCTWDESPRSASLCKQSRDIKIALPLNPP